MECCCLECELSARDSGDRDDDLDEVKESGYSGGVLLFFTNGIANKRPLPDSVPDPGPTA
jgi:hypothetical protein